MTAKEIKNKAFMTSADKRDDLWLFDEDSMRAFVNQLCKEQRDQETNLRAR